MLMPGETVPRQLADGAGWAWPSFSPDGRRMAYAAQDVAGTWQVYMAPTDGSGEPVLHAEGKGPVWSPSGLLAWTGCEPSGACGIFADNPDDDQPPTRLTASINDIGLNWSPNSEQLNYMSYVTGNWDIYLMALDSQVKTRLTRNGSWDDGPRFDRSGRYVYFRSNRGGVWNIWRCEPKLP